MSGGLARFELDGGVFIDVLYIHVHTCINVYTKLLHVVMLQCYYQRMESNKNIICEILDRSDKISAGKGRLWCPIPKCYFLMLSNRTMLTYPVPVCTCPSPSKLHTCKKLLLCTTLTHYNSFATAIAPRSSYCFLEIHNC
jgi:hypothetical protein